MQLGPNLIRNPIGTVGYPQDQRASVSFVLVDDVLAPFKTGNRGQGIFVHVIQPGHFVKYFPLTDPYSYISIHLSPMVNTIRKCKQFIFVTTWFIMQFFNSFNDIPRPDLS